MNTKTQSLRPAKKSSRAPAASVPPSSVESASANTPVAAAAAVPDVSMFVPPSNPVDAGLITAAAVYEGNDVVEAMTDIRGSRKPTREAILASIDGLIAHTNNEIAASRENKTRAVPLRVFKTYEAELRRLRSNSGRLMKVKRRGTGPSNGGFQKPYTISNAMSKFASWNASEPHSRLDITRVLCAYIKTHKLQDPTDGRKILPDKKLAKLLDYNAATEEPLTFWYLQRKITPHLESPVTIQ